MSARNYSKPAFTALMKAAGNWIAPQAPGEGRICILNYHRVLESRDPLLDEDPDVASFRWQMELLAECFNVLPLKDAIGALETQRLPARAVCITFDDGYRSVHDLAAPILKEFNFPATVFVTSGYVGERNMWNDRIVEAIRRLHDQEIDLRALGLGVYPLRTPMEKKIAAQDLTKIAKYLPAQARLSLISRLEELAGGSESTGLMLTREMIMSLARQGIEIGAHTVTHPILANLDDQSARNEIFESKKQLEAVTGGPVTLFAYPNGKPEVDFDERHVRMVEEAGYVAAFTSSAGAATRKNDRYRIPRSLPWDTGSLMFGVRMLYWLAGRGAQT
ncbi:polysaccharide deacetylase [Paucimonas lemoignei]|uniref:Polysaccharide deacetylase n=1 Tax=Paucimonas lemoignei TaxID=29443 RepID=A0A4R3I3Q1_PAULE|nr:polysaccharide deacetylase family protein [Paucimonas lemoignei]TCS38559.1 polysaccharide deacetylase [Paucimonas lemoignei]